MKPYLERPVSHQYLEPLSFSDLKRLRLSLPEEEDEAKACRFRRRPFRRARSAAGRASDGALCRG